MPSPNANEGHDEFIDRCMGDEEARQDFPDPSQRRAFCESQWTESRRSGDCVVETKSVPFECKVNTDQRIVEGYASTFDRDQVDDIIEPGAFRKTISERGDRIKVLWQHMDALGRPEHMEEDSTGLYTRSRISKTQLGDDALTLMADGVVDSMSIGFTIPEGKAEFESDGWTRRIKEIKLFEYSMVTFPANEEAVITGLKHLEAAASRYGCDAFGNRAAEVRESLKNLEALLEGRQPAPKATDGPDQSPTPGADPELLKALQSLRTNAQTWALQSATYPLNR